MAQEKSTSSKKEKAHITYNIFVMWCLYHTFPKKDLDDRFKYDDEGTFYEKFKIGKTNYYNILSYGVQRYKKIAENMEQTFGVDKKYFLDYDVEQCKTDKQKEREFSKHLLLPEIILDNNPNYPVTKKDIYSMMRKHGKEPINKPNNTKFDSIDKKQIRIAVSETLRQKVIKSKVYEGPLKKACSALRFGSAYRIRPALIDKIVTIMNELSSMTPSDWLEYSLYSENENLKDDKKKTLKECEEILSNTYKQVHTISSMYEAFGNEWIKK